MHGPDEKFNTERRNTMIDSHAISLAAPDSGSKILGTVFTQSGKFNTEVRARIAAAWSKFQSLVKHDGNKTYEEKAERCN